jgi:hypothetical protein
MLLAPFFAAGIEILRQHGALEELTLLREVKVGQLRRYRLRAESTVGLDEYSMEYDVTVKTVLIDKETRFVFTVANIRSRAGAQSFSRPGISMTLVGNAERTGWLQTPSFAEGLGASGLPLSALWLPRIGNRKEAANQPITSLDGFLINGFSLAKPTGWPEVTFKVPVAKGTESGFLWLHTKFRPDGWPEWCDGNWQIGDATLVYRLERR